ncbi:MAG: hypothetical protein GY904_17475 [Planctomycetaceae bacterium]|nr:hypothetical protein [Planctomycetaceae bacterium]
MQLFQNEENADVWDLGKDAGREAVERSHTAVHIAELAMEYPRKLEYGRR